MRVLLPQKWNFYHRDIFIANKDEAAVADPDLVRKKGVLDDVRLWEALE